MSQIYVPSTSSMPSIPTQFTTDNGQATPSNNNINIVGACVEDDNIAGIQTEGSGSTVTIELTNRFCGQTLGATGGTTVDLIDFDLGASISAYRFSFDVIAIDTGNGNTCGYTLFATFKTDGITSVRVKSPWIDSDEDTSKKLAKLDMVVDGGSGVILQFTVPVGNTMDIATIGTYLRIGV